MSVTIIDACEEFERDLDIPSFGFEDFDDEYCSVEHEQGNKYVDDNFNISSPNQHYMSITNTKSDIIRSCGYKFYSKDLSFMNKLESKVPTLKSKYVGRVFQEPEFTKVIIDVGICVHFDDETMIDISDKSTLDLFVFVDLYIRYKVFTNKDYNHGPKDLRDRLNLLSDEELHQRARSHEVDTKLPQSELELRLNSLDRSKLLSLLSEQESKLPLNVVGQNLKNLINKYTSYEHKDDVVRIATLINNFAKEEAEMEELHIEIMRKVESGEYKIGDNHNLDTLVRMIKIRKDEGLGICWPVLKNEDIPKMQQSVLVRQVCVFAEFHGRTGMYADHHLFKKIATELGLDIPTDEWLLEKVKRMIKYMIFYPDECKPIVYKSRERIIDDIIFKRYYN